METVVRVMRLLALKMQGGYEPMDAGRLELEDSRR